MEKMQEYSYHHSINPWGNHDGMLTLSSQSEEAGLAVLAA